MTPEPRATADEQNELEQNWRVTHCDDGTVLLVQRKRLSQALQSLGCLVFAGLFIGMWFLARPEGSGAGTLQPDLIQRCLQYGLPVFFIYGSLSLVQYLGGRFTWRLAPGLIVSESRFLVVWRQKTHRNATLRLHASRPGNSGMLEVVVGDRTAEYVARGGEPLGKLVAQVTGFPFVGPGDTEQLAEQVDPLRSPRQSGATASDSRVMLFDYMQVRYASGCVELADTRPRAGFGFLALVFAGALVLLVRQFHLVWGFPALPGSAGEVPDYLFSLLPQVGSLLFIGAAIYAISYWVVRWYRGGDRAEFDRSANRFRLNGRDLARLDEITTVEVRELPRGDDATPSYQIYVKLQNGRQRPIGEPLKDRETLNGIARAVATLAGAEVSDKTVQPTVLSSRFK